LVNFKGTPLNEVLNYLSEAAGFVIVQEGPVQGTVDVVSRQPITAEDAVDLLNTVLVEKGYVAIRNGRILKIVNRKDAQKRDLPVDIGSDPEKIPRKDEMVTQILPLRFGEASKLVENLRPLLAENATISANDSSNSILLTDTRTNIRRIAQIIRAIDTSVASISTIHVYQLKYADAKEMANVISQLFANPTGSSGGSSRRGGGDRGGGPFGMFFGGGPPGSGGEQSEAKLANSRVVAASDEQSNSVIVSAPEDLIPTITEMVEKLDTSVTDVTETRIFRLQHADAVELAQIVNELYPDTSSQNSRNNQRGREGGRGFFGGPFGPFGGTSQQASSGQSERSLLQTKVVAVGDPRTNSLVVTSSRETMSMIAEMVGRLDSTDAKKQRVYVYQIKHADADNVANVLRGMLGDQSATTAAGSAASRLSQRSQSGATMDTSDFSTSGNGRGGGGGGSRDR
jgi:general secretion pathway protein D